MNIATASRKQYKCLLSRCRIGGKKCLREASIFIWQLTWNAKKINRNSKSQEEVISSFSRMRKYMHSRSCKEMREGTGQSRMLHVSRQKSPNFNPKARRVKKELIHKEAKLKEKGIKTKTKRSKEDLESKH